MQRNSLWSLNLESSFLRARTPDQGLSDYPAKACQAEAENLLSIADTLSTANPKLGQQLNGWRQQVNELLGSTLADDLATERKLDELAMELRRQWLTLAHSIVAGVMKSPPVNQLPLLPVSQGNPFIYERVLGPRHAEHKLNEALPEIPGWQRETALFSSGLAAITAAITCLRSYKEKYQRADGNTLRLDMFGGYFETLRLIELMSTSDLCCEAHRNTDLLLDRFSSGTTDILFLELIAYDWTQTVLDPSRLLEALAARPAGSPWILLLDTTLLGPIFQLGPFLDALGERKPILVMEIRSGLKLDQVGLEFSNAGIIRTFTHNNLDTGRYPDAEQVSLALRSQRKILGNALTFQQVAVLDAPWIFHPTLMSSHSRSVMDNNRRLALALSGITGLFTRINHPCLGPQRELSWAESPIVVMEFHASEDEKENRNLLLAVIAREVRRRKLIFHIGASFGFRHHRCEVIVDENVYAYTDGKPRSFFKVAMGARYGPSLEGIIDLLQKIAAFPDFSSLRAAYPKINPERELAPFPDIHTLRLIS